MAWLETDSLSNQDIYNGGSGLAIGSYTADAARHILINVTLQQIAGNGDYSAWITRQIGGAGAAIKSQVTTEEAAAGQTEIMFQSKPVTVLNGDVITVYVLGLAGDTATPDTRVEFWEDPAGRLDVASTGEAGLDFNNIKDASAAHVLTNVSIGGDIQGDVFGDVSGNLGGDIMGDLDGNVTGSVNFCNSVLGIAADVIDADALAADAVAEIQSGLATATNQTTILARIGAFTGTGVNTILGFLRALASKAASTPSDIGGTFLASADSQEAISDRLSSAQITARTIVAQGGDVETYQGADYLDADGYALEWTDSDNAWPTLTGATISVFLNGEEYTGSVVTATGANKKVRYEPTSAVTVTLPVGTHPFVVAATLINTRVVILVAASWESKVMEVEAT